MKFSKFKRAVALVACFACVLSAMPVSVFATDPSGNIIGGNVTTNEADNVNQMIFLLSTGAVESIELGEKTYTLESLKTPETAKAFGDALMDPSNKEKIANIKKQNADVLNGADIKGTIANVTGKDDVMDGARNSEEAQVGNNSKAISDAQIKRHEDETGETISDEVAEINAQLWRNDNLFIDENDKQKVEELKAQTGLDTAVVAKVGQPQLQIMAEAGYSDTLAFSKAQAQFNKLKDEGKSDEEIQKELGLTNLQLNAMVNFKAGQDSGWNSAVTQSISDYYKQQSAFKNLILQKVQYVTTDGVTREFCGGGYTLMFDDSGSIIAYDPGAESTIVRWSVTDMIIDFDAIRAIYLDNGLPEPTDEEIREIIGTALRENKWTDYVEYLYVDDNTLKSTVFYMHEAYTYIREVNFTLTRADGRWIKSEEIPTVTPQSFKQKFLQAKNGNAVGQLVSGTVTVEDMIFENMFTDETHRRRATAYVDAYFRLEEWLCESVGLPLKEGQTFLQFKNNRGWDVRGSKMTLTIDFYKSFQMLSRQTGFAVNDIIRNFASDYSAPQWTENVPSGSGIKGTFTVHNDKGDSPVYNNTTYFGVKGSGKEARNEVSANMPTYGTEKYVVTSSGSPYYSNLTSSINREITSGINTGDFGLGITTTGANNAYWKSAPGKYLGTVHSYSDLLSRYYNGQKINTKMFKLGDNKTSQFGFVPFLLTDRPKLSSAFNVEIIATEYTLYMPAQLSIAKNNGYEQPRWIYFPHREVPAVTQALSTSAGRIQHWDFRDKVEKKHFGPIYEDFFKNYFYDESFYMFYNDIDGKVCTAKQLEAAFASLKSKNLREDMLVYYSGYAVRKGNGLGKGFSGPLVTYKQYASPYGSTKNDALAWIDLLNELCEDDCESAINELEKYGFSVARTKTPEGKIHCYAVFGPALTYNEGGLDSHPHGNCNYHKHSSSCNDEKGNRACGRSENLNHSGHSTCCGSEMDSECKHYYTVEHKCSKGIEPDHLEGCCEYVQPSVTGGSMPTVTFNDTHGDQADYARSKGFAQRIEGIADIGIRASAGGVLSDEHAWAWPTTIEAPPGPGPDPEETTTPTSTTPPVTTPGGNGGGGGSGDGGGDGGGGNPKPWPTPITPPGGLKLYGQEGITIEMFITR